MIGILRFLYLKNGSVGNISKYRNRALQTSAVPLGEATHAYLGSTGNIDRSKTDSPLYLYTSLTYADQVTIALKP
jgi:hypothetical protein